MVNSILVTGANGFIGKHLCGYLIKKKMKVIGTVRNQISIDNDELKVKIVKDINEKTNWKSYLKNIDVIIHTAGYSKFPFGNESDNSKLYNVNVLGTSNLAKQAVECGVKKFIYLSSIKVHGEYTNVGTNFKNDSKYNPQNQYAISKVKAEKELEKIRKNSNLDIIIIRPPLVYGIGLKSNLSKLINLVHKGIPLPFKSVNKNKISLIAIENLNSFIYKCIIHKNSLNINLVISDTKAISTKYLIEQIAFTLNKKALLFNFPKLLLYILGYLCNKQRLVKLLLGNLEIDNSLSQLKLNWQPKVKLREALKELIDE